MAAWHLKQKQLLSTTTATSQRKGALRNGEPTRRSLEARDHETRMGIGNAQSDNALSKRFPMTELENAIGQMRGMGVVGPA